jgi:hypothetical protein
MIVSSGMSSCVELCDYATTGTVSDKLIKNMC